MNPKTKAMNKALAVLLAAQIYNGMSEFEFKKMELYARLRGFYKEWEAEAMKRIGEILK